MNFALGLRSFCAASINFRLILRSGLPEKENRYALALRTKKRTIARAYTLNCRKAKRIVTSKANHGIIIL